MYTIYDIHGDVEKRFDNEDDAKDYVFRQALNNKHLTVRAPNTFRVLEFFNGTANGMFNSKAGHAGFTSYKGIAFPTLEGATDYAKKRNRESRSGLYTFVVVPNQED